MVPAAAQKKKVRAVAVPSNKMVFIWCPFIIRRAVAGAYKKHIPKTDMVQRECVPIFSFLRSCGRYRGAGPEDRLSAIRQAIRMLHIKSLTVPPV